MLLAYTNKPFITKSANSNYKNKIVVTCLFILFFNAILISLPAWCGLSSGMFESERVMDEKRDEIYQKMESEYTELFDAGLVTDSPDKIHGENEWEKSETITKKKTKRGVGGAGYYPSLSVFGQTGYIFIPSLEVAMSRHPVAYASTSTMKSEDLDIDLISSGIVWSAFENFEIGINHSKVNLKSPKDLGYVFPNIDIDGNATSISMKYLVTKKCLESRKNWDNAWAIGVVVPVDTFEEFSGPAQNVLNVIKDTFVSEEMKPVGYVTYGGFDFENRYSVSMYASFGEAFSTGIGFRTNILNLGDISAEYLTTLHDINGVEIDKNQYGLKIMCPIGYGIRFQAHYSYMDIDFAGPDLDRFANIIEMLGFGLEGKF